MYVVVSVYLFPSILFPMISIKLMTSYSVNALFSHYDLRMYVHFQILSSYDLSELFRIVCSPLNISTRSSFSR